MIKRVPLIWWYIHHPTLIPDLFHRFWSRIKQTGIDRETIKREASQWCAAKAVLTVPAIKQITGQSDVSPLDEIFSEHFAWAHRQIINLGQKLPGGGNLELIYYLAEYVQAQKAIETGVGAGWSSLAFLLSLSKRKDSLLISTNMPYPGSSKVVESSIGCAVPPSLRKSWQLIEKPDRRALPVALKLLPSIDICHYDSDKSVKGRQWAYPRLWQALRSGGIFISDDIDDNLAFRDFCRVVNQEPVIIESSGVKGVRYTGVIVKP